MSSAEDTEPTNRTSAGEDGHRGACLTPVSKRNPDICLLKDILGLSIRLPPCHISHEEGRSGARSSVNCQYPRIRLCKDIALLLQGIFSGKDEHKYEIEPSIGPMPPRE